jgi:hypothetical protein
VRGTKVVTVMVLRTIKSYKYKHPRPLTNSEGQEKQPARTERRTDTTADSLSGKDRREKQRQQSLMGVLHQAEIQSIPP